MTERQFAGLVAFLCVAFGCLFMSWAPDKPSFPPPPEPAPFSLAGLEAAPPVAPSPPVASSPPPASAAPAPSQSTKQQAARAAMAAAAIAALIVQESRQQYYATGHPCACPDDVMRNGRRCGGTSAYSRPGGAAPLCYVTDVSVAMIERYRSRLARN
jgi:hypothetical protein